LGNLAFLYDLKHEYPEAIAAAQQSHGRCIDSSDFALVGRRCAVLRDAPDCSRRRDRAAF
jgi:hypothetical protein